LGSAIPKAAPAAGVNLVYPDYLFTAANNFVYWRGSIKFLLQFRTSSFTSARFRIVVLYDVTTPSNNTAGDVTSRIIDVKGDTDVTLTVPYVYYNTYRRFKDTDVFPTIYLQSITGIISISPATDPSIFLNVWRAAGEDFELAQFIGPQYRFQTQPAITAEKKKRERVEAHSVMREQFSKTFDPIGGACKFSYAKNFCNSEQETLITDCMKRYSQGNSTFLPNKNTGGFLNSLPSYFYYFRGTLRYKIRTTPEDNIWADFGWSSTGDPSDVLPERGMTTTYLPLWPLLEAACPQYAPCPFTLLDASYAPTAYIRSAPQLSAGDGLGTTDYYMAAGEDFAVGYLIAPAIISLV